MNKCKKYTPECDNWSSDCYNLGDCKYKFGNERCNTCTELLQDCLCTNWKVANTAICNPQLIKEKEKKQINEKTINNFK